MRIPAELVSERTDIEMEIERIGDKLRIRPARRPLIDVLEKFKKFSPDFMLEERGDHVQPADLFEERCGIEKRTTSTS